MVDKIYELKNKILQRVEQDTQNIQRFDVNTVGELVDIVKDLAEAEDHCWQAEYYKSITKAMGSESYGYTPMRGASTGRSGYNGYNGASGYGSMSSGHQQIIDPIKMAMQSANPEEREHLRNEIMELMNQR